MKQLLLALFAALLITGCCDGTGTTMDAGPSMDTALQTNLPTGSPCKWDSQCAGGICHGVSCNREVHFFCAGAPCDINVLKACGNDSNCIYAGQGLAYCAPTTVCENL